MQEAAIFELHTQARKYFTTMMTLCSFPIDYYATANCKMEEVEDHEDPEQIVVIPK